MFFTVCVVHGDENDEHPNILFILADDVGQEVLGCYGGESYETPHLDRLSATGVRFTNCYSMPLCSPSRTCLLTGRYPFRSGTHVPEAWGSIPAGETTFGHLLQSAGYKVGLSGKWQMNLLKKNPRFPIEMGFNEYFAHAWHEGPMYHQPLIYDNGEAKVHKNAYGPDLYNAYIIDFMKRHKDERFLAFYSMNLAHEVSNDLNPPPPYAPGGGYQSFEELVSLMDKMIGRVVSALDELKLRESTIVIFASDNGTPTDHIVDAKPGRRVSYTEVPIVSRQNGRDVAGGKGSLKNAGTIVPLIVNWPGRATAGKVVDDLVDFSDFLPTFLDLVGSSVPEDLQIDGQSFAPVVLGKPYEPREWAFSEWAAAKDGGRRWVRTKKWKLYEDGRLFNMVADPHENSPVSERVQDPEVRKRRSFLANALKDLIQEPAESPSR